MRKYTVTSRDRSPSGAPEAARGRLGHRWIFEAAELPGRNDHLCLTGWCFRSAMMRTAARLVASGRNTGVPGLPETDDWTAWDADQMRAAIEHLEHKRGVR